MGENAKLVSPTYLLSLIFPAPQAVSSFFFILKSKSFQWIAVRGRQRCGHSREMAETETLSLLVEVQVGSARSPMWKEGPATKNKAGLMPTLIGFGATVQLGRSKGNQSRWKEADGGASPGAEQGLPVHLPLGLLNPSAHHPLSPTHTESLQARGITQPQTYGYCMSATFWGLEIRGEQNECGY